MKPILIFIIPAFILISCAKVPIQSVELMSSIEAEGERMHQMNIVFLNAIFDNKKAAIDKFIKNEYTPDVIENIKKSIPAGVDMNKEWPNVLKELTPKINMRRDSLQNALDAGRVKIIQKLDENYALYAKACETQKKLLESVAKVDNNKAAAFDQFKALSKGKIDLAKVEPFIDKLLLSGGSASQKILELDAAINSLINNP